MELHTKNDQGIHISTAMSAAEIWALKALLDGFRGVIDDVQELNPSGMTEKVTLHVAAATALSTITDSENISAPVSAEQLAVIMAHVNLAMLETMEACREAGPLMQPQPGANDE